MASGIWETCVDGPQNEPEIKGVTCHLQHFRVPVAESLALAGLSTASWQQLDFSILRSPLLYYADV
jgi:hypothetical protein